MRVGRPSLLSREYTISCLGPNSSKTPCFCHFPVWFIITMQEIEDLEAIFIEYEVGKVECNMRNCSVRDVSTQTVRQPRRNKQKMGHFQGKCSRKTEEKDKFWLRAFRSAMKKEINHSKYEISTCDRLFWREYLSKAGEPGRDSRFPSYNRSYKNYLFSRISFVQCFRRWLEIEGASELRKRHCPERDPEMYRMMWEYAEVLAGYEAE